MSFLNLSLESRLFFAFNPAPQLIGLGSNTDYIKKMPIWIYFISFALRASPKEAGRLNYYYTTVVFRSADLLGSQKNESQLKIK